MKIEVPEEFGIFLENALDVVSSCKRQGKDITSIINDIAKFRYYIRGRIDSISELDKMKISKEDQKKIRNQIQELGEISDNLSALFNAILELYADDT